MCPRGAGIMLCLVCFWRYLPFSSLPGAIHAWHYPALLEAVSPLAFSSPAYSFASGLSVSLGKMPNSMYAEMPGSRVYKTRLSCLRPQLAPKHKAATALRCRSLVWRGLFLRDQTTDHWNIIHHCIPMTGLCELGGQVFSRAVIFMLAIIPDG